MSESVICKAGTPVLWDTFSGMIKAVVISVDKNSAQIKVTERGNPNYRAGYVVTASRLHCFPRECYHKTGIFTYRVDNFVWEETAS